MVGHEFEIVAGFGFGGWNASQAVHEALLVEPGDVVGGDVFDVAQGVQSTVAERGIRVASSRVVYESGLISGTGVS